MVSELQSRVRSGPAAIRRGRDCGPRTADRRRHPERKETPDGLFRHRRDRLHRPVPRREPAASAAAPIYVLVRKGSEKKLAAMRKRWGADDKQVIGIEGDLAQPGLGVAAADTQEAQGQDRPRLPPRRDLRPQGERRGPADSPTSTARRNAVRFAEAIEAGCFPPRELDRRGRPLRRHVPRGHVRGGRRPRPSRTSRPSTTPRAIVRRECKRPFRIYRPGVRRRPLEDRRDRQDRRAVLLLQDAAEAARPAAAVDADDRHRGWPHQHRAGGFRRRRARSPRAQEGTRRQVLPPDRPRAAPDRRGAQHLRARRPRAADDDARQRARCSASFRRRCSTALARLRRSSARSRSC